MVEICTPLKDDCIESLNVGDTLSLNGYILCGRDAVLPQIVDTKDEYILKQLKGSVIFHTGVSVAGLGPTSSNKYEIESSIGPLSEMGVKIHLGKGRISNETIKELDMFGSAFAIIPPVTALLVANTLSREVIAYKELGMEAFYRIRVREYPIIIAAIHGRSIFDE